MNKTVQDKKDDWERRHVQRVLDYHNDKYSADIVIKGRATDVYPNLTGQLNWDWVCDDKEAGEEIAVEVKKLTDEKLAVSVNMIQDILKEVQNSLSGKLPGIFVLGTDFSLQYYDLPLRGQQNKQQFKDVLCEAIYKTAQELKPGETQDLEPQIAKQLPFSLPDISLISLYKFGDDGSALYRSSGFGGVWSLRLDEDELTEFEKNVAKANKQLSQATNAKRTILVIIEEGQRITDYDTVANAFEHINRDSYYHIDHIYYISGEKVEEIPLPSL